MDSTSGITPVMPIGGGYSDGFGGGSFMWIFGLLVLLGLFNGGFGGWGNNGFANAIGYENLATSNEVQRGFDNQNLQAQTRDILAAVNSGTAQSVAATNQTFHDSLSAMQSLYNETARDIAALQVGQANALANQNACCCETKQLIQATSAAAEAAIAQSRYDTAMGLAGLEQRLTAKMDQNTIQALRDQVDSLRDQVNMSGVLRFPSTWSYGAGPFPPIFGGCCNSGFASI